MIRHGAESTGTVSPGGGDLEPVVECGIGTERCCFESGIGCDASLLHFWTDWISTTANGSCANSNLNCCSCEIDATGNGCGTSNGTCCATCDSP